MSTFKGKLGVIAVAAVCLITVLFYLVFVHSRGAAVEDRAHEDVKRAAELVRRIQRLHAFELVARAKEIALQEELVAAIALDKETERREAVFSAISEFDRKLRKQNRKPDFLAVVDHTGRVIARDLNIENMYGEKLPYPSIARAMGGRPPAMSGSCTTG
jgi:hypothetical protein